MSTSQDRDGGSRPTQHARLAEQLVTDIVDGRYVVGDRLPTEAELCATHGLSRGTVRHALRHLEDQGLISRRPGAGTTVIAPQPVTRYAPFVSSTLDIVDLARYTKIRNPKGSEIEADSRLAARLGAEPGSSWFVVQGPRTMKDGDGPPMCWSEQYLPGHLPYRKILLSGRFDAASMAGQRIEQEIRAEPMPAEFAAALDSTPDSPALVVVRRHLRPDGTLLSVSFNTHPAERFAITSVLSPAAPEQTDD